MISFEEDLRQLINRHSAEAASGTPDFVLAKLLTETLKTFNEAVGLRAEFRGESLECKTSPLSPERPYKARQLCYICSNYTDDGHHDLTQL